MDTLHHPILASLFVSLMVLLSGVVIAIVAMVAVIVRRRVDLIVKPIVERWDDEDV